jgi:hypothetical protein
VNGRGALVAVGRFEQGSGKVIRGFRATEEGAAPG